MADNETSKIVWIAIVVALAAAIYIIAGPAIKNLATDVFKKVTDLVGITKFEAPAPAPAAGGLIAGIFG